VCREETIGCDRLKTCTGPLYTPISLGRGLISLGRGLKRQAVNRAIKLLVGKGIIVRAPQTGNVTALRLNPHYGWKGKVKHLHQARQTRLQVIEGSKTGKEMRTPPASHRRRLYGAARRVFAGI
jgi:hypothetical protein